MWLSYNLKTAVADKKTNMARLNFSFRWHQGNLKLCCQVACTSTRHYQVIPSELLQPINWETWDSKKQCFMAPTPEAIENNRRLDKIKEHWQKMLDTATQNNIQINNGKELFAYGRELERMQNNEVLTLGGYLEQLITRMRTWNDNKRPSKNFQLYITLLHKLQQEGQIISTPIAQIADTHYQAFGAWLLNGNGSYKNNMVHFKATINKAKADNLTAVNLQYNYKVAITNNADTEEKAIKRNDVDVLTMTQFEQFKAMDLATSPKMPRNAELFRDFCIFMYEARTRPCDTLKLTTTNIVTKEGNQSLCLIPTKKKNQDPAKSVQRTPVTPIMRNIIDKYAKQSPEGYLFPFRMNSRKWNFDSPTDFQTWNNAKQKQLEQINKFLKKVAKALGVAVLTLYTFRHSAFTHAIKRNDISPALLAKRGGTSLQMLEKHYINSIDY